MSDMCVPDNDYMLHSAPMFRDFGSAVLDINGQVVGMNVDQMNGVNVAATAYDLMGNEWIKSRDCGYFNFYLRLYKSRYE